MFDSNNWNHLTVTITILEYKQISSDSFENEITDKLISYISWTSI